MSLGMMSGRFVAEERTTPKPGLATSPVPTLDPVGPGLPPSLAVSAQCQDNAADNPAPSSLKGQPVDRYYREVARLGAQVADALAYAHRRGVLHRDIKPSNLLLDSPGTVWVTDFGLAKLEKAEDRRQSKDIVGTLRYMAPERFRGGSNPAGDLYALGATLYELLALRPAFEDSDQVRLLDRILHEPPEPLRRIDSRIPLDLDTIVRKALSKDPHERFTTAAAMAGELRRFVDGRPILSRPISSPERCWRWCRRNPAVAGLLSAVATLTVVVAVVAVIAAFRERGLRTVADVARKNAITTLADMYTASGILADERRDAAEAVLWFANAARTARGDAPRERANLARVRAWSHQVVMPVHAVSHEGHSLTHLSLHPDGRHLLTTTQQNECYIWDLDGEQPLPWACGDRAVSVARWSPDGHWITLGRPSGEVEIRIAPDGGVLHRLFLDGPIRALAFDHDGHFLAIASKEVRIWDCRTREFHPRVLTHPEPVLALAFSPRGDRLASGCLDGKARVFGVSGHSKDNRPLFDPLPHQIVDAFDGRNVLTPAWIDEGRGLITVSSADAATWWDAETGKPIRAVPFPGGTIKSLVAGHGGRSFALGGWCMAQVWGVSSGGPVGPPLGHRDFVTDLVFSPDDEALLTVCADRTAEFWFCQEVGPRELPSCTRRASIESLAPRTDTISPQANATASSGSGSFLSANPAVTD